MHYIRIYRSEQVMHALDRVEGKVRTTAFAPLRVRQPRVSAGHIQSVSENGYTLGTRRERENGPPAKNVKEYDGAEREDECPWAGAGGIELHTGGHFHAGYELL